MLKQRYTISSELLEAQFVHLRRFVFRACKKSLSMTVSLNYSDVPPKSRKLYHVWEGFQLHLIRANTGLPSAGANRKEEE